MLKDSHSGAIYHSKASLCAANENDNCKCDGTVYFARKFASDKKPGAGSVNTFQEMIDYDKYLFRNVSGILPCKSKSFEEIQTKAASSTATVSHSQEPVLEPTVCSRIFSRRGGSLLGNSASCRGHGGYGAEAPTECC